MNASPDETKNGNRSITECRELKTLADDSNDKKSVLRDDGSANEKTPVLQGFDENCSPVRRAENQKPPKGLEPSTYALRKRRSDATGNGDKDLQETESASCTKSCTVDRQTDLADPDLLQIISAWATMPEYLKAAVMALIVTARAACPVRE